MDKIGKSGRLKSTESTACGRAKDTRDVTLVPSPSVDQSRSGKLSKLGNQQSPKGQRFVPVVSSTGNPLMPTTNWRADELIKKGKALRRFKAGIFYIKLTQREDGKVQQVACGIDPGSKREGFTVKSSNHTYLNILSDAVTHVKDAMKTRKMMRRSRRMRKTPCRKNKYNRSRKPFPPSTKARWQAKLRIAAILKKLMPISDYVVEDIKAKTKGQKNWDLSFSPLEQGKTWFYSELEQTSNVYLKQGFETFTIRNELGLEKSGNKMSESFNAHCVDSWVLANSLVGGHTKPDNKNLLHIIPLRFYRRQLHKTQPATHGIRQREGGTISLGFKKGSLSSHKRFGIVYLGGNTKNKISIHSINTGKRLSQKIKTEDCDILTFNCWRVSCV